MSRQRVWWTEVGGRELGFHWRTGLLFESDPITRAAMELDTGDETSLYSQLAERFGEAEAAKTMDELRQFGILGDCSPSRPPDSSTFDHLWLHVAHSCNMSCRYCYAGGGSYGGAESLIDPGLAHRTLDKWLEQIVPGRRQSLTLFGGEPLLNFPLIRDLTHRGRKRIAGLSAQLTTNGTLITDEMLDFFAEQGSFPMISIDGAPDLQDRLRPMRSGGPSHDVIARNVERIRRRFNTLGARMTITKEHLGRFGEHVDHLLGLGFTDVRWNPISPDVPGLSLTPEDYDQLADEVEARVPAFIADLMAGRERILGSIMSMVDGIHRRNLNHPCSFGSGNALVVSVDGGIYACHRLAGDPRFRIGNVEEGIDRDRLEAVLPLPIAQRMPCGDCEFIRLCGGGCPQESISLGMDSSTVFTDKCNHIRRVIQLAIRVYATLHYEAPDQFGHLFRDRQHSGLPEPI